MKKYLAILRIRFSNTLQYRAAAAAGIATQFAWGFMEILAYSAFYKANPEAFPMQFSQTVTYIWLQQALLALFMLWFWDNDITSTITDGGIAYEMVRPLDLYSRWFCQAAANRLARTLLRCSPILLVALLLPEPYRLSLPPSLACFGLFILSALLGLAVVVAFSMLLYISVFYTLAPTGIRQIVSGISDFFSGAIIPLPFFPQAIQPVIGILPFAAMQNTPLRIYSANLAGLEAVTGICLQLLWLVVLVSLGRSLMSRTQSAVVVQGG